MRIQNSIKNILSSMAGQFLGIIVNLLTRAIFVKVLISEYLGLDGLFSNILTLLSLVELGVGPAITYSMYLPLANNDKGKIKSLVKLYKKLYFIIGTLIFILGIIVIPFLKYFVNTSINNNEIYVIYIIFLINSCVSYFFSYKSSILTTDQKKYIYNFYHYLCMVLYNILQIIILLTFHNYILFITAQLLFTIIENVLLIRKTNKMYPYLKENDAVELEKEEKQVITKNIRAMFMHKIGGAVVNATDNIILSRCVGITAVALYSNYYFVTNNLKKIIRQIFDSIVSSIGNLVAKENQEKIYDVFNKILFLNFWIYTICLTCLITLFNDFINIWVGKEYVFGLNIVIIVCLNFYLAGMRNTVLSFRDAMGLYWHDRYKPIIESIINIVTSIILGLKYGTIGIFIGTLISNVTTNLWIEPLILYKYGFKDKVMKYYKMFISYFIKSILYCIITYFIMSTIFKNNTLMIFIAKSILTFVLVNLVIVIFNMRNKNFIYYKNLFLEIIVSKLNYIKEKHNENKRYN